MFGRPTQPSGFLPGMQYGIPGPPAPPMGPPLPPMGPMGVPGSPPPPQPISQQRPPQKSTFPAPSSVAIVGKESGSQDKSEPEDAGGLSGHKILAKYNAWSSAKGDERREQKISWQYYHGKQWSEEQIRVLRQRKQMPTYYNRIRRKINFLVGTEQRLRRDPKAFANHPKWDAQSSAVTHAVRYVQNKTDAPSQISLAVLDYFVSGIGVLYQGVTVTGMSADPSKLHTPSSRFFYDPRSEKHDFSDAKFLGLWQWIEVDTAAEMMLEYAGQDAADKVRMLGNAFQTGDTSFASMEEGKMRAWVDPETESLKLVEMYYRYGGQWRLAFIVGQEVIADKPSIFLNEDGTSRHAFTAVSCNIDDDGDRYGMVRDMIPIQDQINHRLSKLLHLMSTRQMFYEKGAFKDPAAAHREFMKPDGRIEFQPGRLTGKAFEVVENSGEVSGQAQLLQSAIAEIENAGPNPGLIGRGEGVNQQSGRAILAQQNAGMTELSPEFERIRSWKLRAFKIDWASIRQFWTGEKMIRVTDGRGTEFIGLNVIKIDPTTGQIMVDNQVAQIDVDLLLEEGPDVIVVREEMMQAFKDLGQNAVGPLGKIIIELSGIPDKDRLLKMIDDMMQPAQPPPDVVAMQKQIQDLKTAAAQAQIEKTHADIEAQHANAESKRADTTATLAGLAMQPQQMAPMFPIPFGDSGMPPPAPPMPSGPVPVNGGPPGPSSGAPPGIGGPPGPTGPADIHAAPIGGSLFPQPVLRPGDNPDLGQPGVLPMPPAGTLPAQPAFNGFGQ